MIPAGLQLYLFEDSKVSVHLDDLYNAQCFCRPSSEHGLQNAGNPEFTIPTSKNTQTNHNLRVGRDLVRKDHQTNIQQRNSFIILYKPFQAFGFLRISLYIFI